MELPAKIQLLFGQQAVNSNNNQQLIKFEQKIRL